MQGKREIIKNDPRSIEKKEKVIQNDIKKAATKTQQRLYPIRVLVVNLK